MTYAAPQYPPLVTPKVISTSSAFSPFGDYRIAAAASVPAAQTNMTANTAVYVPFFVTTPAVFTRGWWYNATVPANYGNASVGIYDAGGTRLATTGAVAAGSASVIQSAAFAANVTLTAGYYYMAISFSASGATSIFGNSGSALYRMAGLYLQATGVHPLPASAVFATWSSTIVPVFGIAQTSFV